MKFNWLIILLFGVALVLLTECTKHFSRTSTAYTAHGGGFPATWPSVLHYYEFGGGGYLTIPLQESAFGIEFRYSRIYTYKAHQLALVLSWIG